MTSAEELQLSLKKYLEDHSNDEITEEDLLEISQSLFYLGRAIARYLRQKEVKRDL